jgi:hypothetical protein
LWNTYTETHWVHAWAGTKTDIRKLTNCALDATKAARGEIEQQHADDVRHIYRDSGKTPQEIQVAVDGAVANARKGWKPVASVFEEGHRSHMRGGLDEVLVTLRPQRLQSLLIHIPESPLASTRIKLRFSRNLGLTIEVQADEQWHASSVRDTLADRAKDNRPGWAWLRGGFGALVAVGIAVILFVSVLQAAPPSFSAIDSPWWWLIVVVCGLAGSFSHVAIQRVLPPFEILEPGQRPTGSRRVVWLGTLLAGALLSAIAGLVL